MTQEQQRIAIAEWCGWTDCKIRSWWKECAYEPTLTGYDGKGEGSKEIPDFLNNLNAIHEAESNLSNNDWDDKFYHWIGYVVSGGQTEQLWAYRKAIVHATAAQRAEALLRTIDKWEDGK
jgi:hypothetical protein